MSKLRAPLSDQLRDPATEVLLQEGWRGLSARRAPRSAPRWVWGGALVTALGVAALLLLVQREPEALALADGRPLPAVLHQEGAAPLVLSDDSRLVLAPGTRLELGESQAERLYLVLREGRVDLDVRSHGRTAWRIDCGSLTVEIVGTRLSIERRGPSAVVEVSQGRVRISGPRLVPTVQYLSAGERLAVEDAPELPAEIPAPSPRLRAARRSDGAGAVDAADERRPGPTAPPPSEGAAGETGPTELPPARPTPAAALSPEEHLRLADEARRRGAPAEAAEHLRAVAEGRDGQAALAALTLGKLLLEALDQPQAADEAFVQALARPLPLAMQEIAWARRVEAHRRLQDWAGARALAEDYHRRFPQGRFGPDVDRWSAP